MSSTNGLRMPFTRSAVCTDRVEIWSSEPRIACRSSFRPPTNVRNVVMSRFSCSSRLPMWASTSLRLSISSLMIWSRSARVEVTEAVWASSPSRVPPSPWNTWTIS